MGNDGLTLDKISPKPVLKAPFQAQYINDIKQWLKIASDSNLIRHTYDFVTLDQVLKRLQDDHFPLLSELHAKMQMNFVARSLD